MLLQVHGHQVSDIGLHFSAKEIFVKFQLVHNRFL